MRAMMFAMLFAWAKRRHPKKGKKWATLKYWKMDKGWTFQSSNSNLRLYQHDERPIKRHVKVQGSKTPYDGNWLYWSVRLGRHPETASRIATLLKKQQGICFECGLFFKNGDLIEVDHIIPRQ
jgi:RNA-directed DNA polymerase